MQPRETNILLGDIIKHVNVERKFTEVQQQLQSIVQKVLSYYMDFNKLFIMDNFVPLLDLFRGTTQIDVNKAILETFSKLKETVSDSITINTMFGLAKVAHNSVNALSFADEVRQISRLINAFISKVCSHTRVYLKLTILLRSTLAVMLRNSSIFTASAAARLSI